MNLRVVARTLHGLKTYQLTVKVGAHWQRLCDIEAQSHREAFRKAMTLLKPEHYDKPIRLEQVDRTMSIGDDLGDAQIRWLVGARSTSDPALLAQTIGLTDQQAQVMLDAMLSAGLIVLRDGRITLTNHGLELARDPA